MENHKILCEYLDGIVNGLTSLVARKFQFATKFYNYLSKRNLVVDLAMLPFKALVSTHLVV